MIDRSDNVKADRVESASVSSHTRIIVMLVALCCLCMGIAIGAIMRGIAGAKPEDNRLSISNSPVNPDSLFLGDGNDGTSTDQRRCNDVTQSSEHGASSSLIICQPTL